MKKIVVFNYAYCKNCKDYTIHDPISVCEPCARRGSPYRVALVIVMSILAFNNRPSVSKMTEGEWRGLPLFAFGAFVHAFSGFLVGVSAPFFTVFMLAFLITMPAYGACAIMLNWQIMIWRLGRWQWLLSASLTAGVMAILACIDLIKVQAIQ